MSLLFNKIISSIVQIILLTAIPFIWWCITSKKKQSFWKWIGLKRIDDAGKVMVWIIAVSFVFAFFGALTLYMLRGTKMATSEFAGLGVKAIMPIIVYAVLNTSLPEELLFRGFLLKRIGNKFGFAVGNAVQAVLFGIIHGIMFFPLVGVLKAIIVITYTCIVAWYMGYINEKKADGSIFPSWIIHAVSNIFSGICSAFLII